jgi:DnaJ like chaperone protein
MTSVWSEAIDRLMGHYGGSEFLHALIRIGCVLIALLAFGDAAMASDSGWVFLLWILSPVFMAYPLFVMLAAVSRAGLPSKTSRHRNPESGTSERSTAGRSKRSGSGNKTGKSYENERRREQGQWQDGQRSPHSALRPEVGAPSPVEHHLRRLGLPTDATYEDVKHAYRRCITQYHPDKVASLGPEFSELANEKAKEINAAYKALKRHFDR